MINGIDIGPRVLPDDVTRLTDGPCWEQQEDEPGEELIDYMLEVLELKTRIKYLEAVEQAARRYIGCVDSTRKHNYHRNFKQAKGDLVRALNNFEDLEIDNWERRVS